MYDEASADQISAYARTAHRAIANLNHAAVGTPELLPSDVATVLENLSALAAALPQAYAQLSRILETVLSDQLLTMDEMTDVSDPAIAVQAARDQLEEAREQAVELYKLLDSAHNLSAHIISHGTT